MTGDSDQRIAELELEVKRLEAANAELRRANIRLARVRHAKFDSAAASSLSRERPPRLPVARRARGRARAWLRGAALRILR